MKILILSTSLNAKSKSHQLALRADALLNDAGVNTCVIDLNDLDLPMCGTAESWNNPAAAELTERVREADGVLIAGPVYNYDLNAACKNAIELTGEGWENKVAGFICTAGGPRSYMSVMSLANSLMLDFRCIIVPRFVYVLGTSFRDGVLVDDDVERRLAELCGEIARIAGALRGVE
jgi:NAD(P)H-dependent FMN reductase